MSEPETLQVFAAETIKTKEVPPGNQAPSATAEMTEEEKRIRSEKILTETIRLTGRYVKPHKNKSQWVVPSDIPFIIAEGKDMVMMCDIPIGLHHSAYAIAHPQISINPLRFFMFPHGKAIINPVIVSHTKVPVYKTEGCMSYPNNKPKTMVQRFNKIDVIYQSLEIKKGEAEPSLTPPIRETLNGDMAHIFQHEISHLNGSYVYDENFTPEQAIGFGDGKPVEHNPWAPREENTIINNEMK